MLFRSEAALFLIEQELVEKGFGGTIVPLVADILDRPRLTEADKRAILGGNVARALGLPEA